MSSINEINTAYSTLHYENYIFIHYTLFGLQFNSARSKKGLFNIKKVGFLYNNANDKNFIFDDKDFSYSTNIYKLQHSIIWVLEIIEI